ncbi:hypothetical protein DsansV1_C32g0222801 [Dioscorea sansibarensis]
MGSLFIPSPSQTLDLFSSARTVISINPSLRSLQWKPHSPIRSLLQQHPETHRTPLMPLQLPLPPPLPLYGTTHGLYGATSPSPSSTARSSTPPSSPTRSTGAKHSKR